MESTNTSPHLQRSIGFDDTGGVCVVGCRWIANFSDNKQIGAAVLLKRLIGSQKSDCWIWPQNMMTG
jgi:hypothetical protein